VGIRETDAVLMRSKSTASRRTNFFRALALVRPSRKREPTMMS
jgi:hypothetical protein